MNDLKIALLILSLGFLTWFLVMANAGRAMIASGRYTDVRVGCGPLVVAVALALLAVLL